MADNTAIEWTDATWNPITGCSVVSPGCTNCYAMRLAGGRLKHTASRQGLTTASKAGPVWNGQVRFNAAELVKPLSWRRPRKIFVCAHGDLFHEDVPDAWIDQVFAVAALSPQHTFQVLTKRAARMRAYFNRLPDWPISRRGRVYAAMSGHGSRPKAAGGFGLNSHFNAARMTRVLEHEWPLPNVWLGVSAEDQARADERIPELLATPAAVRFVSAEPLLGPIDLNRWMATARVACKTCGESFDLHEADPCRHEPEGAWTLSCPHCGDCRCIRGKGITGPPTDWLPRQVGRFTRVHPTIALRSALNWVIVGGESGPGARPMHPDWPRQIRDACAAAGVPFFFKQWGAWSIDPELNRPFLSHTIQQPREITMLASPGYAVGWTSCEPHILGGRSEGIQLRRLGKKAAGRLLDGVEHNAMPGGPV